MSQAIATFIFAFSLVSVAGSQLLFKTRMTHLADLAGSPNPLTTGFARLVFDPLFWLAMLMVAVGAVCWYAAMVKLPLSFMLPIASLIAPMTAIGAYFWLGETLSLEKLAAIIWIATGAVWLGYLSS